MTILVTCCGNSACDSPHFDRAAKGCYDQVLLQANPPYSRPRRLAWPRTSPFHGGNTGSNPVGDANLIKSLAGTPVFGAVRITVRSCLRVTQAKHLSVRHLLSSDIASS